MTAVHHSAAPRRDSAIRSGIALVLFLVIAYGVAAFGSLSTIDNVDGWYAGAEKVAWNPPNFLFGPVWTVLYALMSIAAWLVWRRRELPGAKAALGWYVAQLALNAIWTPVFFGAYPLIGGAALWIASGIIVALDIAVVITMLRFARVRPVAAWLLAPYLAWILYATTLSFGLAVLNG